MRNDLHGQCLWLETKLMPKFIVDLWLDGYETEEQMVEACKVFIYEQLNFTASYVKIECFEEKDEKNK